jgi:ankyrin repeat protein
MGDSNNSSPKLSGLGLKRSRSLSNQLEKNASNTKEQTFMKNLKELREHLLSTEPKTKDTILLIFNNSQEQVREALNTIYWEGNSHQTVFFEYCSIIDELTEEEKSCIELMISLGADINKCTTKKGECEEDPDSANALLWAMTKGNLELVTFLASRGATDPKGMKGMMIGHHNDSIKQEITNAYKAGINLRSKGGTRRRRIKKRKTRIYRRIK